MIVLTMTEGDGKVALWVDDIAMIYEKIGREGLRCRLVEIRNDAGNWEVIESIEEIARLIRQARRRQKRRWF